MRPRSELGRLCDRHFVCLAAALLWLSACGRSGLDALSFDGAGATASGGSGGGAGHGASAGTAGHGGRAGAAGSSGFGGGDGGFGNGGGFGDGGAGAAGAGAASGGGGFTGHCVRDADCTSSSFCAVGRCDQGTCLVVPRDMDGDGAIDVACGGTDCNDANPLALPGGAEICGDGSDNDCNGVADCFDPACSGVPNCACIPRGPEDCENGVDDDCNGALDCNDAACASSPFCGCDASVMEDCGNGFDDDCDGATDCADPDCAGAPACACHGIENCGNGVDDDCDGLIDCADPGCSASPSCQCRPPGRGELCNDSVDDDCDGLVDCADPDCAASVDCSRCTTEICDNGKDDDCDGAIDCADSACRFAATCTPTAEQCNNGVDDDRDGLVDCADPDCAANPTCVSAHSTCVSALLVTASGTFTGNTMGFTGQNQGTCGGAAPEAVFRLLLTAPANVELDTRGSNFDTALYVRQGDCGKGREIGCDDDSGGVDHSSALSLGTLAPGNYFIFVDGFTVDPVRGPDVGQYVLNVDLNAKPKELCQNRIDDDGDGYADCADSDCTTTAACKGCAGGRDAVPELGIGACTDGVDDDCDGLVDCADPDCAASKAYPTECCDGLDQNGNGIPDDFSCRCVTSADCAAGELCYTHTIGACGDPCEDFVGDICVFAAPGSTCNMASQQCEF